jgi:uncharacterized protein (DUF1697 family)
VPTGAPATVRSTSRPSTRRISARVLPGRARHQRDVSDGRDAGERLAAKAQRGDALQVGRGADFARGVTQEGRRDLVRRDAAAIVLHADEAPAAVADFDANLGRARVEAVLDQLLDGGGGALNNFARSDLVGDFWRKHSDRHEAHFTTGAFAVPRLAAVRNGVLITCGGRRPMRFVTFYRNVNLGQPRSPTRPQLERALSQSGAGSPQSFQTNGTVVFVAESLIVAREVVERAAGIMATTCGLREPAFTIELEPLARLVAEQPFARIDTEDVHEFAATFMADEDLARLTAPLVAARGEVEVIRVTPFVVLSVSRRVGAGTGYATAFLEKLLGMPATTRAWGTIERLTRKHGADDPG